MSKKQKLEFTWISKETDRLKLELSTTSIRSWNELQLIEAISRASESAGARQSLRGDNDPPEPTFWPLGADGHLN